MPPFLTKARLFEDGLSGSAGSQARRERFLISLGLPRKLSSNRLLEVVNATMTEGEYRDALAACARTETGKTPEKVTKSC